MKKQIIILILLCFVAAGCSGPQKISTQPAPTIEPYKEFVLPPLPGWTDKYASSNKGDMSFFMISKLVEDEKLSRLQAIELQNHFRDLTANGMGSQEAFDNALKAVQANRFESKLTAEMLQNAPFIVAVDMDETLLQQSYANWKEGTKYDYVVQFDDGSKRKISMAPGWKEFVAKIKSLGGLFVLFSANTDYVVWDIANTVMIDDQKLSAYADGVMTNNYLILQGKQEWVPQGKTGTPVVNPSKDLRLLDPKLEKVIIVDDNPKRIIQDSRLRIPKKYEAELYSFDTAGAVQEAYNKQLIAIAGEIEESYNYSLKNQIPFAQAYAPYTSLGQVTVTWLSLTKKLTPCEAIDYVRKNPGVMDQAF